MFASTTTWSKQKLLYIYDSSLKNDTILEDVNAKISRKDDYLGKKGLYEKSNKNGEIVIDL